MGQHQISKMAAGKQAGSSMKLLLLVGLLLCSGAAAQDCIVNIAQGETSFTGSLSKIQTGGNGQQIMNAVDIDIPPLKLAEGSKATLTNPTASFPGGIVRVPVKDVSPKLADYLLAPGKPGKPGALVLANWYKESIKAQIGPGGGGHKKFKTNCRQELDGKKARDPSYQKLVIRQTGAAAINVKEMSDAMLEVHTRVKSGEIDVDFKYVNEHGWTPSGAAFIIVKGVVIANDCLVKIEQRDDGFTGSLSVAGTEKSQMTNKETFDLTDGNNLANALALAKEYKTGIQGMLGDMKENTHGCISSHWEISQTGKMEDNDDWAAEMSKEIRKEHTRVRCSNNDNGTPFSNCIPVDFKAGTSKFTIFRGKVEGAAGPKAAAKKAAAKPAVSIPAKARRLL